MRMHDMAKGALGLLLACGCGDAFGADNASGYFRIGETRLDVHHALAVVTDPSGAAEDRQTQVYLSEVALDPAKVAAAFDPDDAVREQAGDEHAYVRICIDADGGDCGLFFSPESFNSGGYGDLTLAKTGPERIAGRWVLARPEDFFGKTYEFDLQFDSAIAPAPGQALAAGGGEPGAAYNAYLDALARGDIAALRAMAGEDGDWRFDPDDPTGAKEELKSLRDGQPLHADIERGLLDGDQAILWVTGIDRDEIHRRGRVLMHRTAQGWRYAESDLDHVDEPTDDPATDAQ